MKTCTYCKIAKPLTEFHRRRRHNGRDMPPGYRRPICKICEKTRWPQKWRKRYPADRRTTEGRKIWQADIAARRAERPAITRSL